MNGLEEALRLSCDVVDGKLYRTDYYGCLYREAAKVQKFGLIVELGSYRGNSAIAMLCGSDPSVRVVCIDPLFRFGTLNYPDVNDPKGVTLSASRDNFEKRIAQCGFTDRVEIIPEYSWDTLKTWTRKIDMLLVDAQHNYSGVLQDCSWFHHLKPNAVALVDDWLSEVETAVRRFIADWPQFVIEHESTQPPKGWACITTVRRVS